MPKPTKKIEPSGDLCRGGRSFNCKKIVGDAGTEGPTLGPHMAVKWQRAIDGSPVRGGYYCRFCDEYMGCKLCADRPSELACLRCHDWALMAGERAHGRMVKNREAGSEALKIARMIVSGSLTEEDGIKLFAENFRV